MRHNGSGPSGDCGICDSLLMQMNRLVGAGDDETDKMMKGTARDACYTDLMDDISYLES
jgi:hypothetical protein